MLNQIGIKNGSGYWGDQKTSSVIIWIFEFIYILINTIVFLTKLLQIGIEFYIFFTVFIFWSNEIVALPTYELLLFITILGTTNL